MSRTVIRANYFSSSEINPEISAGLGYLTWCSIQARSWVALNPRRARDLEPPPSNCQRSSRIAWERVTGMPLRRLVVRDGKADVAFTGTLLGSAATSPPTNGHWQEYRVYETTGGKHVFSKVNRSVYAEDQDGHQADVFEPSPSSVPSQLLRSARDLTRSHPLTWMDAAVAFFGYDPLAKTLYRKLSGQFEEHIS
jgi:hypothetical protein